jgi:hypothetical protein
MRRRNDKLAGAEPEHLLDSPNHPGVRGNAACENHRLGQASAAAEAAFQVSGKRKTKAGDDVARRRRLLLEVDHVALGKYGAATGHSRRAAAFQGKASKLVFNADSEPLGLLVKKRAGSGGAGAVEREVADRRPAALPFQENQFAVLAAHLNDSRAPQVRVQRRNRGGLGRDFVHEAHAKQVRNQAASRSSRRRRRYPAASALSEQLLQLRSNRLERPAARAPVAARDHGAVGPDRDNAAADRTDIKADAYPAAALQRLDPAGPTVTADMQWRGRKAAFRAFGAVHCDFSC